MLLGVGPAVLAGVDVADELPAQGLRMKHLAVGFRERPEDLDPVRIFPEPIGVADRMARLVTHQHHRHLVVFDLAGLLLFDPRQSLVGQIERDADDRHAVGATPGVGQIERRAERPAPSRRTREYSRSVNGSKRRAFDLQPKIADPRVEQFTANGFPTVERRCSLFVGHAFIL